jgi:hypothetical protein
MAVDYPLDLLAIRDEVVVHLLDEEKQKLIRCRFKSRCHSRFCPLCLRVQEFKRGCAIVQAMEKIEPCRLKFATLTCKDVLIGEFRDTVQTLMRAGRQMFDSLRPKGYALACETSHEAWSDLNHVHLHSIVDSAPNGRGYISAQRLQEQWELALGTDMRPESHIQPVRSASASGCYIVKSPFTPDMTPEAIAKTLAVIEQSRGLQRFNLRGSLSS